MTISKKNQPSEESVGNVPYYRTSSPLEIKNEQTRLSIKHTMPALHIQDPSRTLGCPIVVYDDKGQPMSRKELELLVVKRRNDLDGDQLQFKIIKDRKMEVSDLHPSTQALIKDFQEKNHKHVARTDTEYRLQHVLDKEGIGAKLTPLTDHGNSHNREMLPGSKITDCYGSKGVVVRVVSDEDMPAAQDITLPRGSILQSVADEIISIAIDTYGKEQADIMIDNKHAPLHDAIRYILNQVDDAGAMYIERAIGEQYGLNVLNKTKAAKAKKMESIKAARSAD